MLVKLCERLTEGKEIRLEKYAHIKNNAASRVQCKEPCTREAFPTCTKLSFRLYCPREYGVIGVCLKLTRDGGETENLPFDVCRTDEGEIYSLSLDLSKRGEGLYYYNVIAERGPDSLYSKSVCNTYTCFVRERENAIPARLLVYDDDFDTPQWFHGATMYHIFVDRFKKSGKVAPNPQAENCEDWSAPISQFGEKPGDFVKNNLFYGGDLYGIAEKLPYLNEMGVSVLYLSPIFKAESNHKYDTCDYTHVDEYFGSDEAFFALVEEAKKYKIRIILDGVFNHTGDQSIYFDKCRKYGNGAYRNPESPYRDWYFFDENENYSSWWGIEILPKLNHNNDNCLNYFAGERGIGAKYASEGIGGWRLDVADELSDKFLDLFRKNVKSVNPEAVIIGEVWENAADKIAYGRRRRYLRGKQLDSVMNYPFRDAVLDFLLNGNAQGLSDELSEIYSSYPPCVVHCLMNILGTHDTERILTVLGDKTYQSLSNRELSTHRMSQNEYENGKKLLKIASAIQYTVYGVPSVFYGDEAGMQGGRDPFCRGTYPWGNEDAELLEHYKKLGKIRRRRVYKNGEFRVLSAEKGCIVFERYDGEESVVTAANVSEKTVKLPLRGRDLLSKKAFTGELPPKSAAVVLMHMGK